MKLFELNLHHVYGSFDHWIWTPSSRDSGRTFLPCLFQPLRSSSPCICCCWQWWICVKITSTSTNYLLSKGLEQREDICGKCLSAAYWVALALSSSPSFQQYLLKPSKGELRRKGSTFATVPCRPLALETCIWVKVKPEQQTITPRTLAFASG